MLVALSLYFFKSYFALNATREFSNLNCRMIEHTVPEGAQGDRLLQLLAPHSAIQNSNAVSESNVQTLFDLWHPGAVPAALGAWHYFKLETTFLIFLQMKDTTVFLWCVLRSSV